MSIFFWSADCLHCLCSLPHTLAQHTQEMEQARYERHMLREEGKRELADGELDEERMAWETLTWEARSFRVGGETVRSLTVSDTIAQGKGQERATASAQEAARCRLSNNCILLPCTYQQNP